MTLTRERETYRWKKRPYAHQVQAIKKLLQNGWGGALLMEPRTGKTKTIIDYISILHQKGRVNRVLVIGPVSAMGVWEDELKANCPFKYRLLVWDRKTRKRENLPSYGKDILDIVIMNYDALSTPGAWHVPKRGKNAGKRIRSTTRGGRYTIKKEIKKWAPQMIVLDESHRIKSPSARKTTAILSLSKIPSYRVIMTGTVVTKKKRMFDIYAQWLFLNPERFKDMTFSDFKNRYGKWIQGGEHWQRFIGPLNEDELHAKIHQDAFSITRAECYDLPRRSPDQLHHIPLEESAKVYDQMAEDMVARIKTGEITEASIKLVQGMRLRQITSGLSKTLPTEAHPQGRLVVIGSEKLRFLESRLEDLMEADEKVVIGAVWKGDIYRIQQLCKKHKWPQFTIQGGMKQRDREYARKQFPKVDGGAIFIGQPAAASEAIDLSAASIMIWYSLTPSWVNYSQFCDRIALSNRPTFYEYLLAGPVDELLYETLQEDGDIGKKMITSPERLLRLQEGDS